MKKVNTHSCVELFLNSCTYASINSTLQLSLQQPLRHLNFGRLVSCKILFKCLTQEPDLVVCFFFVCFVLFFFFIKSKISDRDFLVNLFPEPSARKKELFALKHHHIKR